MNGIIPVCFLLLLSCVPARAAAQTNAAAASAEEKVQFATDDEWQIKARFTPPAAGNYTLVLIHTQKSDSSEWNFWLPYLRHAGLGYLALDLRGHGESTLSPVGSTVTWRRFDVSGANNDYNKMVRDVSAAINFLGQKGVTPEKTVLVGSVLGANLAIKTAAIIPEIAMVIALSPALNANDVLTVNPLRMACGRRPLLLVGGVDHERQFKEFLLINDIARGACGTGNVTVMIEYQGLGQSLVNKYNIRRLLSWIKHSRRPEVAEDFLGGTDETDASGENGGDEEKPDASAEDGQEK